MGLDLVRLSSSDFHQIDEILEFFAAEFDDSESYLSHKKSQRYLERLLGSSSFICLAARIQDRLAGCLVAYELIKFEQERSDIYIDDVALSSSFRRRGVATALIDYLKGIAKSVGAWVIFVQADTSEGNQPAINLYTKLGTREEVLHFDIDLD